MVNIRFRPAWVGAFSDYTASQLQRDLVAGLVVGIVALPLAIAFAIASGADPRSGLVTAALAGMVVAIFGGSRVQVVGPTGAFVVILYGITQGYGIDKLFVATFMAGVLLLLMGLFRLGNLIKFIPYPVTTGFTAGIAVIIFLGQLQHILGLRLGEVGVKVPGDAPGAMEAIVSHLDRLEWPAVAVAVATILIIQGAKRFVPRIPGPPLALVVLTLLVQYVPGLHVQTVGDLFTIPQGLPGFAWPDFSLETMRQMAPSALTIALLGAIESLLSAVVADGMTGFRHDSNQELMAQGLANVTVPLFGGIAATGAIARTATNVQMGARTPVAALVHGVVVFAVLAVAAPLVVHIPMAVLGGILAVVAWNMSERHRFRQLLRMPMTDAGVMVATFALTVLVDLTFAVSVGMVLAAALFLGRMSNISQVNVINPETDPRYRQHSLEGKEIPPGVVVYSVDGPFFFGAAERFEEVLDRTAKDPKVVIFRMRHVPYLDATALNALTVAVQQLRKRGTTVILSAVQTQPLDLMMRSGFTRTVGDENIQPNIDASLQRARDVLGLTPAPDAAPPAGQPA
jgi:sulfate permease, SulP family